MQKQQCNQAVLQILTKESDETHTISMSQILSTLDMIYNLPVERHTVARAIHGLSAFDHHVQYHHQNNGYALVDHLFSKAEEFILCNCIHASPFINQQSSELLIKKILSTGSKFYKSDYFEMIYHPNPRKVENIQFANNMETVYKAISKGYKISFDYMHYLLDMRLHIKNADSIIVEPRYITYQSSQAYLIVTGGKYPGFMAYRFDKIANVKIIHETVSMLNSSMDACEYSNSRLFMYSGETMNVTFRFNKQKLDLLVDAFGLELHPNECDASNYICTVKTTDNAALIFAQKYLDIVEIVAPVFLRSELQKHLKCAIDKYSNN